MNNNIARSSFGSGVDHFYSCAGWLRDRWKLRHGQHDRDVLAFQLLEFNECGGSLTSAFQVVIRAFSFSVTLQLQDHRCFDQSRDGFQAIKVISLVVVAASAPVAHKKALRDRNSLAQVARRVCGKGCFGHQSNVGYHLQRRDNCNGHSGRNCSGSAKCPTFCFNNPGRHAIGRPCTGIANLICSGMGDHFRRDRFAHDF